MREKMMSKNVAQAEIIDRMAYEYMKIDEFHREADQLRRIVKSLETRLEQKESAISRSKLEARKIQVEKPALNERLEELQRNLEEMNWKRERNSSLMRVVAEELSAEDLRAGIPKKGSSSIYTIEDMLRIYDHVFGRLASLFDKVPNIHNNIVWIVYYTMGKMTSKGRKPRVWCLAQCFPTR